MYSIEFAQGSPASSPHNLSYLHHSFIHSISQSTIHPFNQSGSHSVIHSFNQSVNHSFIQSVSYLVIHSVNHSFSQSFSHSVNHSFIHSFIQSFSLSFSHSVNHSFSQSFIYSVSQSVRLSVTIHQHYTVYTEAHPWLGDYSRSLRAWAGADNAHHNPPC